MLVAEMIVKTIHFTSEYLAVARNSVVNEVTKNWETISLCKSYTIMYQML